MTVRDLIEALGKYPSDYVVVASDSNGCISENLRLERFAGMDAGQSRYLVIEPSTTENE